jgi:hypothetical protein
MILPAGATWAVLLDDSEVLQLDPDQFSLRDYLAASNATIFHCMEEKPHTKVMWWEYVPLVSSEYLTVCGGK